MRDYRDAKAMAQSLRAALADKAVTLQHSECLELIAKSFGVETWNILSAQIETTRTEQTVTEKLAEDASGRKQTLYCSFCGKSQYDVQKLIVGPSVLICDDCVNHVRITSKHSAYMRRAQG